MDELLNLSRLARRLKVSQAWLKAEADAGRIPSVRAGSHYLFSAQAVEQAILERAANPPREANHAN